ncbi:hypothetical protein PUN28_020319 [Cardiocondyla obscurior]|uniref:G-protein coupled receptors family 2 profile 2 domain-containing protein n=1 Tax=Cardiocondyla obscurior TaxID=286306 RepID=A0AAW2E7X6_9HYME
MADPTLQTFCCHYTNRTDRAIAIMQEFNTDAYNTVCMLSSTIHDRRDLSGVFVRSALWRNFKSIMPMEGDMSNVIFCAMLSAWIQYFYMATWIWTLCYAVDMKLLLGDKDERPVIYHTLAWVLPAILTTFGLVILYIPDANCHNSTSLSSAILRILPNYFATYVLLAVVMIANPICIASSETLRQRCCSMIKFALINLVYYVCWTPNLINGILLWTLWFQLPIKAIITLWYIMAVTNPLQAFFNAIVYQSWTRREKLRLECCQDYKSSTDFYLNAIVNVDSNVF